MADRNRLTGLLTMCRRAGKLLLGFDAVKDAIAARSAQVILLAQDASPKTAKEIRYYAGELPVRELPFDMETLRGLFRRRTAVLCISDAGFAESLLRQLPAEDAAPPEDGGRSTEM